MLRFYFGMNNRHNFLFGRILNIKLWKSIQWWKRNIKILFNSLGIRPSHFFGTKCFIPKVYRRMVAHVNTPTKVSNPVSHLEILELMAEIGIIFHHFPCSTFYTGIESIHPSSVYWLKILGTIDSVKKISSNIVHHRLFTSEFSKLLRAIRHHQN